MATTTNQTPIGHTADADFRVWILEFEAALVAIGLVVTTDTGQLTLATAVRPTINLAAGYRVYKTNDGLADLFIKIEYGTGTVATYPQVWIAVGTGTDGAGTITALGSIPRATFGVTTALTSTSINYSTRASGGTGWWWITFKVGCSNAGLMSAGSFALFRFANGSAAATTEGFVLYTAPAGIFTGTQVRTAGPFVSTASAGYCLLPANISTGTVDTDIQFWKHYTAQPRMRVNPWVLTCDTGTASEGTQRSMTVAGATAYNFISVGPGAFRSCGVGATAAANGLLLPWQ